MAKFKSTCSVCFASHKLYADGRPTRHGFSIVTQGHGSGHWGAWHTGPCPGSGFPHLGASTTGTEWALATAREQLEWAESDRDKLATRPPLEWIPRALSRPGRLHELTSGPTTLLDGFTGINGYQCDSWTQIPTYEKTHTERTNVNANRITSLTAAIARYEETITTWQPFAPTPVKTRAPVRHARTINRRGKTRPACSGRAMSVLYADTATEVTCSRCKRSA